MRAGVVMLGLSLALVVPARVSLALAARDSTARDSTRRAPARDSSRAGGPGVAPVADSLPSADARAVLRSIPEPLAPDEQVAPPDSSGTAPEVAPPDTSAADTTGVPTPEPTAPLGETPGGPIRSVLADSLLAAPARPNTPGTSPAAALPGAAPDACWKLQIAAPLNHEEAEGRRAAAESQLLVPMAIESDATRHKVRSRDCLTHAAAEALRARALASGFEGVFLVRLGAGGVALPAAPAKPGAPGAGTRPAPRKPGVKSRSAGAGTHR